MKCIKENKLCSKIYIFTATKKQENQLYTEKRKRKEFRANKKEKGHAHIFFFISKFDFFIPPTKQTTLYRQFKQIISLFMQNHKL